MDFSSAIQRKRQAQVDKYKMSTDWEDDPAGSDQGQKKGGSSSEGGSNEDRLVAKLIEKLKEQGLVVNGQGQSPSDLLQEFSKDYGKEEQARKGRADYETPPKTNAPGTTGYGKRNSDESDSDDFSMEEDEYQFDDDAGEAGDEGDERDGVNYVRRGDESQRFQKDQLDTDAKRIMEEGLDEDTINDIKRKGGKARGLYQHAQKFFAKKTGKY